MRLQLAKAALVVPSAGRKPMDLPGGPSKPRVMPTVDPYRLRFTDAALILIFMAALILLGFVAGRFL